MSESRADSVVKDHVRRACGCAGVRARACAGNARGRSCAACVRDRPLLLRGRMCYWGECGRGGAGLNLRACGRRGGGVANVGTASGGVWQRYQINVCVRPQHHALTSPAPPPPCFPFHPSLLYFSLIPFSSVSLNPSRHVVLHFPRCRLLQSFAARFSSNPVFRPLFPLFL